MTPQAKRGGRAEPRDAVQHVVHMCRKKSERGGRFGGREGSGGNRVVIARTGSVGVDRVLNEHPAVRNFGVIA